MHLEEDNVNDGRKKKHLGRNRKGQQGVGRLKKKREGNVPAPSPKAWYPHSVVKEIQKAVRFSERASLSPRTHPGQGMSSKGSFFQVGRPAGEGARKGPRSGCGKGMPTAVRCKTTQLLRERI